jgi:hypothetical protein
MAGLKDRVSAAVVETRASDGDGELPKIKLKQNKNKQNRTEQNKNKQKKKKTHQLLLPIDHLS